MLLCGALGCLAAGPAALADGAHESLQRIEGVAIAAVTAQLPASAQVTGGSVDNRLRLPACTEAPVAEPPALRGANATVTVRCGDPAWTVYVPLRISDLRPVVVLARAATRGESVDANLVQMQQRDVAQLPFGYFDSAAGVLGYELRRALTAGSVLTPNDAQPPRLVRRGEMVTLVSRSGGLEVRAGGTAMGDGAQGARVRVRNNSSRRVVEGVVTAAGVVEVRL